MIKLNEPLQLLGNISPAEFMAKYWQKKPLLIRGAVPDFANAKPLLSRKALFSLAGQDDVESRLIVERAALWEMQHGPFKASTLPSLAQPRWTLLVQGVDLHHPAVHALKNQFRFAPDARLDDVMISFATDGGGVGPHVDSYDVFLLQAHGQRRWRIGKQKDLTLQSGVPLKILANFQPTQEFVLNAGDMLYLPPNYAHEGVAVGECMTYSIGFRAPAELELASELLHRLADDALAEEDAENSANDDGHAAINYDKNFNNSNKNKPSVLDNKASVAIKNRAKKPLKLYKDAQQAAVQSPAQIPAELLDFAQQAMQKALSDPDALARHLGEYLTEPKAHVWFDVPEDDVWLTRQQAVALSPRSQMMFNAKHVFLNGESWRAAGKDAVLMRRLANQRYLTPVELAKASEAAMALLQDWVEEGWLKLA